MVYIYFTRNYAMKNDKTNGIFYFMGKDAIKNDQKAVKD